MAGKKGLVDRPGSGIIISLSPEDRLLIDCARLDISPERRQAMVSTLKGKLDWDRLIQKATWHRLLMLVSHHLRSPELSVLVSEPVLDRIKNLQYHTLARNLVLLNELSRLLQEFNKREIPVIMLKGAALLGSIYHDISLRTMNDLDVLVQSEHLALAEAIAFGRGYVYQETGGKVVSTKKNGRHLDNMILPEKNVLLEIHQHIVDANDPYRFDLDGFWARAEAVTVSGARALTLAPADLLVHLSIKFLLDRRYHSNKALGQLCDISEVIHRYGQSLDWSLLEKTCLLTLFKGLHFVLYSCRQLLQTPVPSTILEKLKPRDFDPVSADLFIRRRVVDTRPWLAHGLLDARITYSRGRIVRAIAARFSSFAGQIFTKNGHGDDQRYGLRHSLDILPRLVRVLLIPAELKKDLQLDRWLHDLYKSN